MYVYNIQQGAEAKKSSLQTDTEKRPAVFGKPQHGFVDIFTCKNYQ